MRHADRTRAHLQKEEARRGRWTMFVRFAWSKKPDTCLVARHPAGTPAVSAGRLPDAASGLPVDV
jgi:hypothetical protein